MVRPWVLYQREWLLLAFTIDDQLLEHVAKATAERVSLHQPCVLNLFPEMADLRKHHEQGGQLLESLVQCLDGSEWDELKADILLE